MYTEKGEWIWLARTAKRVLLHFFHLDESSLKTITRIKTTRGFAFFLTLINRPGPRASFGGPRGPHPHLSLASLPPLCHR